MIGYNVLIDSIKKSIKKNSALAVGISGFAYSLLVWVYKCIPILTSPSIFCAQKNDDNKCAQRIDDNKICMLSWVVDNHPEWKELAERVEYFICICI